MFPIEPNQQADNVLWRLCFYKEIFLTNIQYFCYFLGSTFFRRPES